MTSKLLDFPAPLLGLELAVSKPVFWPMYEYTVGISGLAGADRQVFETLMLKLIDAGCTDPVRMSRKTGLEMDFVQFLLQRLEHTQYIHDDLTLTLTPMAERALRQVDNNKEQLLYFLIYRDAISGQMMPVMIPHGSEQLLAAEDVSEGENNEAGLALSCFQYKPMGSTGKADPRTHRVIAWRFPSRSEPHPPSIIEIQKIAAKYARDTGKRAQAIRVEPASIVAQPVYVRVDVMLQATERKDWLVTDGFGGDLSPVLERALTGIDRDEQNWLKQQRKKSTSKPVSAQSSQAVGTSAPTKPMQEIYDCLHIIRDNLRDYIENPQTSDQLEEYRQIQNNAAISCYSAFEWVLFYAAKKRPGEKDRLKQLYRMGNKETIGNFVTGIAGELDFIIEAAVERRMQVKAGTIRGSMNGQPELWSLLALNFADAHEDSTHPLHNLVESNADLLVQLSELGQKRNAAAHGDGAEMSKEEIASWLDRITACSAVLLPDFDPGKEGQYEGDVSRGKTRTRQQQLRYEAEIRVEEGLGLAVQRAVPQQVYSKLVRMEMCRTDKEVIFRPEVVGILYELLEQCLWQLLHNSYADQNFDGLNAAGADTLTQKAFTKAFQAGFKGSIEELKSLSSATPERILGSLGGRKNSLQAHCIAYLLKADTQELQLLARELPYMLIRTDHVASLRGHGHISQLEPATSRQMVTAVTLVFDLIRQMVRINIW
ncbi:hypothetical protein [Spirochaeta dissipatitropha]